MRDYPRVNGVTALIPIFAHLQRGLSPRERGHPGVLLEAMDADGTIPA